MQKLFLLIAFLSYEDSRRHREWVRKQSTEGE